MSIDLTQSPKQVADAIIKIAEEHRRAWIDETVKNHRRLAGFTEKDVPTDTTEPDSTPSAEVEPGNHRYVTTFNVTRNFFYRLLGRVMPVMTRYQVLAATRDQDDRDAAKIGARYLRSRTSPDSGQDFEGITRAISYLFAGGPVYFRVEQYGDDVDTGPVLGFDVYTFPGIMELNESPAIVLKERLTRLVIERRYPELVEKLDWAKVTGAKWPDDVDFNALSPKLGDGCYTVCRLLIRPTNTNVCNCRMEGADDEKRMVTDSGPAPEGREYIMLEEAPGKFIRRDTIGTPDKMYPLVTISDVPMGPFYEDRGRMTISSRMQRTVDICVSKTLDVVVGGPQVVVGLPTGGRLTQDKFTNEAWVFYDKVPGQEPSIQEVGGLNNLMSVINLALQFMGEVHAQSPASRGQSEGERQSGKALEHMTAMDTAVDEPFLAMIRRALARIGKRILMVAQKAMREGGHKFVDISKNQHYQMMAFNSADLKEGFDVRVLPTSGMPENKAARFQLVIKGLGQIPLFSDDPAAVRARDLLQLNVDDDETWEFQDEEEQVIRREDAMIAEGTLPEVSFTDTGPLHRARHKQALMRLRAQSEKPLPPRIEAAAKEHDQRHVAQMQADMAAMSPPQPIGPAAAGAA